MESATQTKTDTCPCGENLASGKWHARRGQKNCPGGRAARREYDKGRNWAARPSRARSPEEEKLVEKAAPRKRVRKPREFHVKKRPQWTPGTPISIPEYDPL